jgi:hypothetical protein
VSETYSALSELQDEPQFISGDWPVTLRRPSVFISNDDESVGQAYVSDDPHPYDTDGITPRRLHPPFMATAETQLPGFQRCYESFVQGEFLVEGASPAEVKVQHTPYYMYVAVVPAAQAAPATEGETDVDESAAVGNSPADDILARVSAGLGVSPGDWETLECMQGEWDDASAVSLTWKRLSVEAEQEFLLHKGETDTAVAETLPGRFDVCLYEGAKYHVIIAWRVPLDRGVEGDFDLDAVQKACLGSLQGAD